MKCYLRKWRVFLVIFGVETNLGWIKLIKISLNLLHNRHRQNFSCRKCFHSFFISFCQTGVKIFRNKNKAFRKLKLSSSAQAIHNTCLCFTHLIWRNFLVWKIFGKALSPHYFERRNCTETVFPQNLHTRKLGEIMVFTQWQVLQIAWKFSKMYLCFCIHNPQLYNYQYQIKLWATILIPDTLIFNC